MIETESSIGGREAEAGLYFPNPRGFNGVNQQCTMQPKSQFSVSIGE
jgi:hypothetical protein